MQTVRRNLTNDHVTAMVTVNARGDKMLPYLIFPGVDIVDAPIGLVKIQK